MAVVGFKAVAALVKYHPDKVKRLFLREDRLDEFRPFCRDLAARRRPYKLCEDAELEAVSQTVRHQGVVAIINEEPLPSFGPDEIHRWAQDGDIVLILDSVGNDHNLGAIIRSAAFFGCKDIVVSYTDREARLTTACYRVAEGGVEHVRVFSVHDIAGLLRDLSKLMPTVAADHRARLRLRDLETLLSDEKNGMAIVLGNEETGIPDGVKVECRYLVRIPGTGLIESLNVAEAATVFLHEAYEWAGM
jgi:TrmH RNA methyltransferase